MGKSYSSRLPSEKRKRGSVCAGHAPQNVNHSVLPFVMLTIQGVRVKAIVDSGCEQSVLRADLVDELKLSRRGPYRLVTMLNGQVTKCSGEAMVIVQLENLVPLSLK